ncbi:uncharacterized protein [Malus domestica]|uniref:uncharacterized protein n=1 Tax=Malus domestica TaxID=3750 RepID=UPI000498DD39
MTQGSRNSGSGCQAYGRINAMTKRGVKQDPRVITGTLLVYGNWAHVVNPQPTSLGFDMFIQLPPRDLLCAQWEFRDCPVIVERELMEANLIPFNLVELDVILGMDWLSRHNTYIGCGEKLVTFDRHGQPTIMFQAYVVTQGEPFLHAGDVPVVNEFTDVFPEDLLGLPPTREIEFTIDLLPSTNLISLAPYRMALAELRELKIQP